VHQESFGQLIALSPTDFERVTVLGAGNVGS